MVGSIIALIVILVGVCAYLYFSYGKKKCACTGKKSSGTVEKVTDVVEETLPKVDQEPVVEEKKPAAKKTAAKKATTTKKAPTKTTTKKK